MRTFCPIFMSEIVFNTPFPNQSGLTTVSDFRSQVENLQTTLASLNQQVIILQEALQERDQEIAGLRDKLTEPNPVVGSQASLCEANSCQDNTLTIVGALINLYRFIFPPGKAA